MYFYLCFGLYSTLRTTRFRPGAIFILETHQNLLYIRYRWSKDINIKAWMYPNVHVSRPLSTPKAHRDLVTDTWAEEKAWRWTYPSLEEEPRAGHSPPDPQTTVRDKQRHTVINYRPKEQQTPAALQWTLFLKAADPRAGLALSERNCSAVQTLHACFGQNTHTLCSNDLTGCEKDPPCLHPPNPDPTHASVLF